MFINVNLVLIFLQTNHGAEYLLITPGNSLYFPAVDFIRASVGKAGVKLGSSQLPVIVDCRFVLGKLKNIILLCLSESLHSGLYN